MTQDVLTRFRSRSHLWDPLSHVLTSEPEHCGLENGSIKVAAAGGRLPYRYSLVALPDQSEPEFSDLHFGTYSIRTTDDLGCVVQSTVGVDSVGGPTIGEILVDPAHCGMADGIVEVFTSTSDELTYGLSNGNTSDDGIFNSLSPGVYQLTVSDSFGCRSDTSFAVGTLDGPSIGDIILTHDNCNSPAGAIEILAEGNTNAFSYSIDGFTFAQNNLFAPLAADEYTVVVRDSFGCESFAAVTLPMDLSPEIAAYTTTHATCDQDNGSISIIAKSELPIEFSLNNEAFQSGPTFAELHPGSYFATVVDENGCTDTVTISIDALESADILEVLTTDESCHGDDGEITVVPKWSSDHIQYSIDGSTFQDTASFSGLQGQDYTVYIIDENGCIDSTSVLVQSAISFDIQSILVTDANCGESNGSISIQTDSSVQLTINEVPANNSSIVTGMAPGTYSLVMIDEKYCSRDTTITIRSSDCDVFVPNIFTPNGDGVNDVLQPHYDVTESEMVEFQVFDRWGNTVFRCTQHCAWDGSVAGSLAQPGVYVYSLTLEDSEGTESLFTGDVTVMR